MIGFSCGVCGVMFGVSITILVAEWLACRAHAKWLKIVDRHERVIENLTGITEPLAALLASPDASIRIYSRDSTKWPGELVEVTDDWTDWRPRRFEGESLAGTLRMALEAREAAERRGREKRNEERVM